MSDLCRLIWWETRHAQRLTVMPRERTAWLGWEDSNSEMSVFCNLGRAPWVYRAFSYQRLFADAEKGPMQIAPGQSDICEFESYMPSHAVVSSEPLECAENSIRPDAGQLLLTQTVRFWIRVI